MNAAAVHWDILTQDLRYTARTLNRARGFALTAIVIVALGVGANTAAFSVTDFVLFRPLPFQDADRLVTIWQRSPGYSRMELSPANIRDWKRAATSFERIGIYRQMDANLDRHRRAGTGRRRVDQRRSVSDPGRAGGSGTHIRGRRRRRTGSAGDHPERQPVADGVRRGPERPRAQGGAGRPPVLGDWRHAAGFRLSLARRRGLDPARAVAGRLPGPHEQRALCGRPAQTRRHARGRTLGDGRDRGAEPPAVSQGERAHGRDRERPPRRTVQPLARDGPGPQRGRVLRAADRLRQRRQPPAGAGPRTPPGARGPDRDGCGTRAADPSARHRKRRPRDAGRRARRC